MPFQQLGLCQELVTTLAQAGYSEPTPIQAKAIPTILEGRDVIAAAQTGTGKTAGFTLPMLHRLAANPLSKKKKVIRGLIITPTRELADQVHQNVTNYARHLSLKAKVVFGGVNMYAQISRIRQGCDIVVATPGRLLDLVKQKAIDLSHIEVLVLDEADRMLDMGFINDISEIISKMPKKRQTLLFSATFSKEVKSLAGKFLYKPEVIEVARQNTAAESVTQVVHPVDQSRKRELLAHLIGSENWKQVLVFTRTKHGANRLSEQLCKDGLRSTAIHGDKNQAARTRALAAFKSGKVRVLVATDVAARGIDIQKLPCVVNFNLPNQAEDYVHRIGRTGRAQNEGLAVSLLSADEASCLFGIEKLLKTNIEQVIIPGYEPTKKIPKASKASKSPDGAKKASKGRFQFRKRKRSRSSKSKSAA